MSTNLVIFGAYNRETFSYILIGYKYIFVTVFFYFISFCNYFMAW